MSLDCFFLPKLAEVRKPFTAQISGYFSVLELTWRSPADHRCCFSSCFYIVGESRNKVHQTLCEVELWDLLSCFVDFMNVWLEAKIKLLSTLRFIRYCSGAVSRTSYWRLFQDCRLNLMKKWQSLKHPDPICIILSYCSPMFSLIPFQFSVAACFSDETKTLG